MKKNVTNINYQSKNDSFTEMSTINKQYKNYNIFRDIIKRTMDIMISIIGIIFLIPLTIIIGISRKILKEEGSIFYKQVRLGKNGKYFYIYKFRTMVVEADEILDEYLKNNEEIRKEFEKKQKLKNDFRVTRLGKFLRKLYLDEVPQVINVLKGDMSLIGPRPIVDREVPLFGEKITVVQSVRPGITGYWAANTTDTTTYEERVTMEVFYAENYSLKLDILIFIKTIIKILTIYKSKT